MTKIVQGNARFNLYIFKELFLATCLDQMITVDYQMITVDEQAHV